jgi:hypothetical protein
MAAPNIVSPGIIKGPLPIQTIQISATYQINGGTAITAGATVTDASKTFTGAATTDKVVALAWDDAVQASLPAGLVFAGITVTAANTVSISWTNTNNYSVTPPATSQQYWLTRFRPYFQ